MEEIVEGAQDRLANDLGGNSIRSVIEDTDDANPWKLLCLKLFQ